MEQQTIAVQAPFTKKDAMKAIPGSRWDPFTKSWLLPVTEASAVALRCIPGMPLPDELAELAPDATEIVDTISEAEQPLAPMPIKVKPYSHQIAAYNGALKTLGGYNDKRHSGGGYAFLHEQGCGKSLTAIATAGRLGKDREVSKILIVAPLAVLPVWKKEWEDYSTLSYTFVALQGSLDKRLQALSELRKKPGLKIAAVNYEVITKMEGAITSWAPDMIICDESQRIKSPQAKQSKTLHRLGAMTKFRMILTGTPVGNTPLDFWSQYRFLDQRIFETSYYAFRNHYAVMGGYGGYEIVMYKHLDELTRKAHGIAHRVTKAQALDLPERVDQVMYCELEPAARKIYSQLVRTKVAEWGDGASVTAPQIVTQMMRLSQICGGYVQPDDAGKPERVSNAKQQLLRELLSDRMDAGEKVVVFARFRAEIIDILDVAKELVGDGVRAIWGDVPGKEYGVAVSDFQTNPEVKIFVAQIQAAGAGITLHAAHTAVFYSLDYSFLNYDQAKARIHRIGQHSPCVYIHLLAKDTIDEEVLEALKRKRSIADNIVDNWRSVFGAQKGKK